MKANGRILMAVLSVALAVSLPSCGPNCAAGLTSASCTPLPPDPPPPPPSPGRIELSQPSTAQLCFSPLNEFFFRLRVPVRFRETGGQGVNVNFVRFSLFQGAREVERREVTADALRAIGAQRVGANATVNATLGFDFNADPDSFDTVRIDFSFTDDRGTPSSARWDDVTDLVLSLPFCTI